MVGVTITVFECDGAIEVSEEDDLGVCVKGFRERHSERRDGKLGAETTEEKLTEKGKKEKRRVGKGPKLHVYQSHVVIRRELPQ
jgi:hypothetical protein